MIIAVYYLTLEKNRARVTNASQTLFRGGEKQGWRLQGKRQLLS